MSYLAKLWELALIYRAFQCFSPTINLFADFLHSLAKGYAATYVVRIFCYLCPGLVHPYGDFLGESCNIRSEAERFLYVEQVPSSSVDYEP